MQQNSRQHRRFSAKDKSMSNEIQQQLEDLKQRMDALEKAEIKLRIQSVGPRGPQGPAGPPGIHGERGASNRGDTGRNGANGANGRDGRNAQVDYNEVEARLIQILIDYGLVSETVGPLMKFIKDTSFLPPSSRN
jgi:hypothetical protein